MLDFCIRRQFVIHAFFMQFSQIFNSLSVPVWIMSLGKFERTTVERMCKPCIAQILTKLQMKVVEEKKRNQINFAHQHSLTHPELQLIRNDCCLLFSSKNSNENVFTLQRDENTHEPTSTFWSGAEFRSWPYLLEMHTPMEWFSTYAYFVCVEFQASPNHYVASIQLMCLINLYEIPMDLINF